MNIKRFALASFAVVALVAGVLVFNDKGSSTVYAKDVAQKSIQTVSQLSSEKKLELGVPTDAVSLLNEAKNAKDLVVLTYGQVKEMLPNPSAPGVVATQEDPGTDKGLKQGTGSEKGFQIVASGNPEEGLKRFKQAKFLQYTRSGGEKVLLGIDQNNVAFFASVRS